MNLTIWKIGWLVFAVIILMGLFGWLIPQRAFSMGGHGGGYYNDHMNGYYSDNRSWNDHMPGYGSGYNGWHNHMNDAYHNGPGNGGWNNHRQSPDGYYNRGNGSDRDWNKPGNNRDYGYGP